MGQGQETCQCWDFGTVEAAKPTASSCLMTVYKLEECLCCEMVIIVLVRDRESKLQSVFCSQQLRRQIQELMMKLRWRFLQVAMSQVWILLLTLGSNCINLHIS